MKVRAAIVMGLLGALVLVSCDGDDDGNRLSEAELTARANGICAGHAKFIEDESRVRFQARREVPSVQQIQDFAQQVVVPELDKMLDELDDINPPEDEEEEFNRFVSRSRKALEDDVKQDPVAILSEEAAQDPFRAANEDALDANLTECARVSQRIRTAAAARS